MLRWLYAVSFTCNRRAALCQHTVTLIVDGVYGALGICCLLNCYEISAGWDLAVCALVKTSAEGGPDFFCPFAWQ